MNKNIKLIKSAVSGDSYYLDDNYRWEFDGRHYDLFYGDNLIDYCSDLDEFLVIVDFLIKD